MSASECDCGGHGPVKAQRDLNARTRVRDKAMNRVESDWYDCHICLRNLSSYPSSHPKLPYVFRSNTRLLCKISLTIQPNLSHNLACSVSSKADSHPASPADALPAMAFVSVLSAALDRRI